MATHCCPYYPCPICGARAGQASESLTDSLIVALVDSGKTRSEAEKFVGELHDAVSDDRVHKAAVEARAIIARQITPGGTPHLVRNAPRARRPLLMSERRFTAMYAAFFALDQALDGWAYRVGPE